MAAAAISVAMVVVMGEALRAAAGVVAGSRAVAARAAAWMVEVAGVAV